MAREHTSVFLEVLKGEGFAQPNPRPMFPNPPGLLRVEPHSPGLRDRIWWGAGTRATAEWTAEQGMNLMSSTLLTEDTGVPVPPAAGRADPAVPGRLEGSGARPRAARLGQPQHLPDRQRPRPAAVLAGAAAAPTRSASSTAATPDFGRTYAGEPDKLIAELAEDEAIAAADTLLLTVPNQLGVDYNAHVIESVLTHLAPELGWRSKAT